MSVFLASGPVSGVQVKTGAGSGASASRRRSSQQAPEGAVFSGGTGGWKGSKWTRIFSPQTAVVYYTQEKNHKLKTANKRRRGGTAPAPGSVSGRSIFTPGGSELPAPGSRP